MAKKRFLGYQIESRDGTHDIPEEFYSFEIIKTKKVLDDFFSKHEGSKWMVLPIYEGDIGEDYTRRIYEQVKDCDMVMVVNDWKQVWGRELHPDDLSRSQDS